MSYSRNYRNVQPMPRRTVNGKTVFVTVVIVLLALAALVGLNNVLAADTKTINPAFTNGSINEIGDYVKSDSSIYTKGFIECKGLETELDFDSNVTYQVFFYDEDKKFVSATEELGVQDRYDIPETAEYARIVITPDWELINADLELDEDEEPENVINWYDVTKYSSQLKITVARETDKK